MLNRITLKTDDAWDQKYVDDLLREGNVLYTKDGKSIDELLTQRRHMPKWESANTLSKHSISKIGGNVKENQSNGVLAPVLTGAGHLRRRAVGGLRTDGQNKTAATVGDGVKYAFEGYDEKTGKGKYVSNYPLGTPKTVKAQRILFLIQEEKGKVTDTHKDVYEWLYFANNILFCEYNSKEYEPYKVSINIKRKPDGEFVYSYSAEKEKNESSTRQTLHADDNQAAESDEVNARPSDSISDSTENSNKNFSVSDADYLSAVGRGDTETAQWVSTTM